MSFKDITNPEVIRALIERHEKSTKLRLKWNNLHKDLVNQAATFKGEEKGYTEADVAKSFIEAGLAATFRDHFEAGRNRRRVLPERKLYPTKEDLKTDHPISYLGDAKDDLRLDRSGVDLSGYSIMRPVPLEEKTLIYKDLPEHGRLEYLKKRYQTKPEDKFYFEVKTSYDYGWRLKDSPFGRNVPKHPRQTIMKESLQSRTGLQPDPEHYKSSDAVLQNMPCTSELR